eukprot:gnl/Chilomastix_cuspidata/2591.p2 GENE.gnl/Chilomastix_cuspidata/2591~~gnl/Chilomastix_cuspidata/2591.p2  ORF type:complete len:458 (-),score=185.05 gnl/Chilomastix_cuspidata/2591:179-1552(-)
MTDRLVDTLIERRQVKDRRLVTALKHLTVELTLQTAVGIGENPRFPGANPVMFLPKHTNIIATNAYYVCEKTDGTRFFLLISPVHGVFLISRKWEFLRVALSSIPPSFRKQPTLLDGELVTDLDRRTVVKDGKKYIAQAHRLVFYIFDAMTVRGEKIIAKSLDVRLGAARQLVKERAALLQRRLKEGNAPRSSGDFRLVMKKFFDKSKTRHVVTNVFPRLPHHNDGLIFTPVADAYVPGTCWRIVKWKPLDEATVDFLARWVTRRLLVYEPRESDPLVPPPDVVKALPPTSVRELWLFLAEAGLAKSNPDGTGVVAMQLRDGEDVPTESICECAFDPTWRRVEYMKVAAHHRMGRTYDVVVRREHKGGWVFHRTRPDKSLPNSVITYRATCKSIKDFMSLEDLCKLTEGKLSARNAKTPFQLSIVETPGYDNVPLPKKPTAPAASAVPPAQKRHPPA